MLFNSASYRKLNSGSKFAADSSFTTLLIWALSIIQARHTDDLYLMPMRLKPSTTPDDLS